jgi:hypothetical protein
VACNFLTTRVQWARGRDAAKPAHVGEDVGDDVGMWLMCDSCWRLHQGAVACGGAPASSPQSQSPLRVPGCAWLLQLRTEAVAGAEGAVVIAFTRWWCWAVVTASNPVLVNGHMKAHSSVVRLNIAIVDKFATFKFGSFFACFCDYGVTHKCQMNRTEPRYSSFRLRTDM